jgi:hypothetical protein
VLVCGVSDSLGYLLRAIGSMLTMERAGRARAPAAAAGAGGEGDQYDLQPSDVVVLAAAKPSDAALNAMYPGSSKLLARVTFLAGSPSEAGDLIRAGVMTARAAVVLTASKSSGQDDNLADDSDAIVTSSTLFKLNPGLHVISELLHGSHAPYLRPNGATLNDAAWAACLGRVAAAGGGTVFVPNGTFLSSPFNVTTNGTTLLLGGGAVLRATPDEARWPLVLPLPSLGSCREFPAQYLRYSAFLTVWNASGVRITSNASAGEAPGVLYGDGPVWWARRKAKTLTRDPGALLELTYCDHVEVDHVDVLMSPYYHVHPFASAFLHFHDMTISSLHGGSETDGLDPDSSHDVLIERVAFNTGDDCIAVKSGWDQPGINFARPSYNILVRDSTLSTEANGFCMGSEMSGGIYNVTALNVSCVGVDTCFRLKSALGRGGEIRDVAMLNSSIVGAKVAVEASDFYGGHPLGPVNASLVPRVRRMTVRGLTGVLVEAAGSFAGLPAAGGAITDVLLEDVVLDAPAGSWACANVTGASAGTVRPAPCAALAGAPGSYKIR